MEFIFNLSEIKLTAKKIWQQFSHKKIWAFYGQMGAGKTTFIHALCEILEVKDSISSPTFALINEYKSSIAGTIFHMDWYRVKDEQEAQLAGMEDCLLSGNLCLVEWAEKAEGLLPDDALDIFVETIDEQTRKILIQ